MTKIRSAEEVAGELVDSMFGAFCSRDGELPMSECAHCLHLFIAARDREIVEAAVSLVEAHGFTADCCSGGDIDQCGCDTTATFDIRALLPDEEKK